MKRSYRQNCALAYALDLLGERWTLLIVRELLIGPRRYGELQDNLVGIGTNLLADRLHELQGRGVIEKRGPHYVLSELGRRVEPAIAELVRFGLSLGIEDDARRHTRPQWDVVALRALYRPELAEKLQGRYVLELDGQGFCIEKLGDAIRVSHTDECPNAMARVALSKHTARRLASGQLAFDDASRSGDVLVGGRKREARALLRSFSMLP